MAISPREKEKMAMFIREEMPYTKSLNMQAKLWNQEQVCQENKHDKGLKLSF